MLFIFLLLLMKLWLDNKRIYLTFLIFLEMVRRFGWVVKLILGDLRFMVFSMFSIFFVFFIFFFIEMFILRVKGWHRLRKRINNRFMFLNNFPGVWDRIWRGSRSRNWPWDRLIIHLLLDLNFIILNLNLRLWGLLNWLLIINCLYRILGSLIRGYRRLDIILNLCFFNHNVFLRFFNIIFIYLNWRLNNLLMRNRNNLLCINGSNKGSS